MESNTRTWTFLLGFTATLFLVAGIAMLIFDTKYISGIQYLASSVLFYAALFLVRRGKIRDETMFNVGFIFTAIGLSQNIGLWALGIIIFLSGLFRKEK